MKISLKCEESIRKLIEELLFYNGFQIEETSTIVFIEKTCLKDANKSVYLVFDKNDLTSFVNFIKEIKKIYSIYKPYLNYIYK